MAKEQNKGGMIAYFRSLLAGKSGANVKEAVRSALDDKGDTTDFSKEERELLTNILQYGDLRVEDVMVPRSDLVAVDIETSLNDLIKRLSDAAHSRMPVYHETLDNIQGLVHVKDVLLFLAQDLPADSFQLGKIKRPLIYAPPSMKVIDLLANMRKQRIHMAIVVDEYGGTDGLVTIEDLVEQIVGEIEDEHDVDEDPELLSLGNNQYMADARIEIDDLEEDLGRNLALGDRDEDVDTLGGLLFTLLGEVPEIGTCVDHENGVRFEIVDADPRRIKRVRLTLRAVPKPESLSDDGANGK